MLKDNAIISTKLHLPFTRAGLVDRTRLRKRIHEGLHGPLTLVTAPAGFGKTTLVASAVSDPGYAVAWLSLDKDDNQVVRFLRYLIAALQEADPTIASEAIQMLAASPQAPLETILTGLINDLDAAPKEIVLVLDDYQFIRSQDVHSVVAFLLDYCPSTFHLVIATRSDPPLPISRIRARGQLTELRAADLRFSASETAQFLNDIMDLHLEAGAIAVLEERTEGWIAGLQMAALSMRNRDDVLGFIEGFSGTHRFILDYLLEEVLTGQSPEVQRFLLYTSILERLSAPLCDSVLEDEGKGNKKIEVEPSSLAPDSLSPALFSESHRILEYLEQANLFLVPLDDERSWYRYHHLFADLLRTRLDQIYPGMAPQLHGRAAAWLERSGMTVEAVNHALLAGEYDRAARLVEENTTRLLAQGELNALMGWIETLPAELSSVRPWLCVHQAYALAFAGRLAGVASLLAQAEKAMGLSAAQIATGLIEKANQERSDADGQPDIGMRSLAGAIAAIRAMVAVMSERDAEAITWAQQAMALLPAERLWDRAAAAWALGYALRSQSHLPEARNAFEEQVQLGRAMDNIWTLVTGLTDLAQVLRAQGWLRQAGALFEEALNEASQQGARSLGYIARMEASLAGVLYERNELESASQLLSAALAHTRQWPNPNHLAYAYALQARLLLAQGDLLGAWKAIGEADRVRNGVALTRLNRRMVEANLVLVWLALQAAGVRLAAGDSLSDQAGALVTAWNRELTDSADNAIMLRDEGDGTRALTLARVAINAGRPEEALLLLARVNHHSRAVGHIEGVISSLVLTALASHPGDSYSALEEALGLAQPEGYVRVFLDEGPPMQLLLAQWLGQASPSPLRNYAYHLLSIFKSEGHVIVDVQEKVSPGREPLVSGESAANNMLVEPLSQRELEVLQLIAQGITNKEIARQLFVARGTVKAHAASIYRKLDVANRTEAVARARQLGILP